MGRIKDRIAIIIGAGGVVGRSIARRFSEEGATVVLVDQRKASVDPLARTLKSDKRPAHAYELDVTVRTQVDAFFENVEKRYGRIDILVNTTSIRRDAPLIKMDESYWKEVLDVNLTGSFYCMAAAARIMTSNNYGKIILIGSHLSPWDRSGHTNFVTAGYGIQGLTKGASLELSIHNINVNCIVPDYILDEKTMTSVRGQELFSDEYKEMAVAMVPLRRMGSPEDIANLALFLASEESSFITGQVHYVQGGP